MLFRSALVGAATGLAALVFGATDGALAAGTSSRGGPTTSSIATQIVSLSTATGNWHPTKPTSHKPAKHKKQDKPAKHKKRH